MGIALGVRKRDGDNSGRRRLSSAFREAALVVGELGGSNFKKFIRWRSFFSQSGADGTAKDGSSASSTDACLDLPGESGTCLSPLRNTVVGVFRSDLECDEERLLCAEGLGSTTADGRDSRESTDKSSRCLGCRKSVSCTTRSAFCPFVEPVLVPTFLFFLHGFTQSLSKGPRRDAERMKSGLPCRWDSASLSILRYFAARASSSSSSSEPSTPSRSMSEAGGGQVSRLIGETGRGYGIGVGWWAGWGAAAVEHCSEAAKSESSGDGRASSLADEEGIRCAAWARKSTLRARLDARATVLT